MRVGIDASNIREGGGVTHLCELLAAAEPSRDGVSRVVVWGSRRTLDLLPERPWLTREWVSALDGGLVARVGWQHHRLHTAARGRCDALFIPGGMYTGPWRPFVAMSRNLLPFDARERRRYGWSAARLRLMLLARAQTFTFRRASGVIFLTEAARTRVEASTGPLDASVAIIPHGVSERFRAEPRKQEPIEAYSMDRPFRWLYVSSIDRYKHQWHVAEAVAALRARGMPVTLDLFGVAEPTAMRRLESVIQRLDNDGRFLFYRGPIRHEDLPAAYQAADGFVFASSCETFGQILVEAMASGLPIASSDRAVMPEMAGDACRYFDPERSETIADALAGLMTTPTLRDRNAWAAYERAKAYSWRRCAEQTFDFIVSTSAGGVHSARAAPLYSEPQSPDSLTFEKNH